MIYGILLLSVAVCVNTILAAIAGSVAGRCKLQLQFTSPVPMVALAGSTVIQALLAVRQTSALAACAVVIAVGAVAVCAVTDAQTGYVFDAITFPSATAVLTFAAANHAFVPAALGVAAAAGSLGILYALTWGRGLGLGDVKLGCCIGALLGVSDALTSVGLAFVLGGVYASYILLIGRGHRGDTVHFAPYLATGMLVVAIYRMIA